MFQRYRMEMVIHSQNTGLPYPSSSCGGQVSVFPRASDNGGWVCASEAEDLLAERDAARARVTWLESRLKRLAELEAADDRLTELGLMRNVFELAQRFRNADEGPAGESLELWLADRLQLLNSLSVLLLREQRMGKV